MAQNLWLWKNKGLIGSLKAKLNQSSNLENKLIGIHCIIHREALCPKSLRMRNSMDVVSIVNILKSKGLKRLKFVLFLKQIDSKYADVI